MVRLFITYKILFFFLLFSWGGCIVALCNSVAASQRYINELKENYYKHLENVNENDLDNIIFATSPQGGAEIFVEK